MYEYDYGYATPQIEQTTGILGAIAVFSSAIMLISLAISIIALISQWKIYKKAGKGGWECLIPIYNFIVLLQIVELPMWYIALFFVPIANIYAMFKIYIELAHKFGKSTGFGVLTVFFSFICLPILAFSKNCIYQGNVNVSNNQNINNNQNSNPVTNNTTNNDNQNNIEPQPIIFNQNINTEINPVNSLKFEPIAPINNQQQELNNSTTETTNNQIEEPMMNNIPTPMNEQNQGLNVIPSPTNNQPIQLQQENATINNSEVGTPINNPVNHDITSQTMVNNPQPELNVIPSIQNTMVEQTPPTTPEPLVESNILNNQQQAEPINNIINNEQPQPITFNQEPQNTTMIQGLNVIPTIGPTPNPTNPNQNVGNNQNM